MWICTGLRWFRRAGGWCSPRGVCRCTAPPLERGEGLALRVLMQRTGGPAAGMHLDFAAEDVAATVARHVGLGASVVRRVPGQWTTLRDPAGREYCVTARSPGLS
ncbi:VOC family protein [Actinoplanes sp. NPDC051470]|uniref:VOC family protein n=1 Tax=Actinoplanes sp. NPDC051470 TaxID=3157224 RepID=UPI003430774F